ncbi:MAG: S41 family peptidase [Bacteroidota bacterium]
MPLTFSGVLIAGMVLGFNLHDTLRNKRDISSVAGRDDRLEEIIGLINERYVDTVNSNGLYKEAISGILKSLDPHTVYIPADEVQSVNEDLDGNFPGIGVEFSIVRDTVEVTSVTEKGPAGKAGVEVGDKLLRVGDSMVAGKGISSEQIIAMLKGKKSTSVALTIKRPCNGVKQFSIVRDDIPLYSVDASIMLDGKTGFIKINRFSATTYDEFREGLTKLKAQGAKQLILDLRDNPGGYLSAATSIADDLLGDNKLIVYTEGQKAPKSEFKATAEGLFEEGKVAVLVDEGSASASEILAGAIQDWDRGVIIGRRTFGKGLVQEQYDMPDGAALRLTIAKYYTPSGRCIQRSFANGREAYMEDYEKRFESGELTGCDTIGNCGNGVPFFTSHHRTVYGGGGIKPDVYVPYDTTKLTAALMNMILSPELKTAVWDYFMQNKPALAYKNINDFSKSFNAEKQVVNNYIAMLPDADRKSAARQFTNQASYNYFRLQVKAQLARFLFHDNGYYSIRLQDDAVVNKALETLNSGRYSHLVAGK